MNLRTGMLAFAITAGLASVSFGQIKGTASFKGEAPEPAQINLDKNCAAQHPDGLFDESLIVTEGKVQNVVVSIKAADGQTLKGEVPKTPVKLDQKGCQYIPHVAPIMIGQELVVANSDAFLHNVHSLSLDNAEFNFGQPNIDAGKSVGVMKVEERFKIKCDVHPWMAAHINVFPHPFFAVTKENGTFEIPTAGLADGKYTVVAWQESLGEQEGTVEVKDGKGTVDFTFKPEAAMGKPVKENVVTLASLNAPVKCASCPTAAAPKSVVKAN